jgi:hypothetical protein
MLYPTELRAQPLFYNELMRCKNKNWRLDVALVHRPMNDQNAAPKPAKPGKAWQKTSCANLIRYVPSGVYYARSRVEGKLRPEVGQFEI